LTQVTVTAVADPGLRFFVNGPGVEAVVYPDGRYVARGPRNKVTEAVYRALAEWYALDRERYNASNARKVFKELKP
jgi:hypothetical protein